MTSAPQRHNLQRRQYPAVVGRSPGERLRLGYLDDVQEASELNAQVRKGEHGALEGKDTAAASFRHLR
jgi:hypothetical protein